MFAFLSRKIILPRLQLSYERILKQLKKHEYINESLKIGSLLCAFLFFVGVYLYFINASSTLGYYLKQEQKSLSNKQFEHNALILEKLQLKQILWQQLSTQTEVLHIDGNQSDLIRVGIPKDGMF